MVIDTANKALNVHVVLALFGLEEFAIVGYDALFEIGEVGGNFIAKFAEIIIEIV
jgi:hypothetical protein